MLGAVPVHPSESHATNTNVLDTKPIPPTAGTRLSVAVIIPQRSPPRLRRTHTNASATSSIPPSIIEVPQEASQTSSENSSNPLTNLASGNLRAFVFGDGTGSSAQANAKDAKDASKRRKPKSSMNKSGSSFVSRNVPHEFFSKRLQERSPDGVFAFANTNRAFQWLDLSNAKKACYPVLFPSELTINPYV